jgi:phosphatidylglycerol:prolipoprotein diacylglycerol transferase
MFPRIFQIGDSEILILPTYGVLVAIGFLLAIWLGTRLGRKEGIRPERVVDLCVWGLLVGLLGSKIVHLLMSLPEVIREPARILSTLRYAGVFYAGLLSAVLFGFLYSRYHKLSFAKVGDVMSPTIALAHIMGRLGCFCAGCCWGRPTSAPWSVVFRNEWTHERVGTPLGVPLHPVQLYEAGGNLIIVLLLVWIFQRKRFDGQVAVAYAFLYGISRFIWEFLRGDTRGVLGPLSTSQWLALLVMAGTAAVLIVAWRRRRIVSPEPPP